MRLCLEDTAVISEIKIKNEGLFFLQSKNGIPDSVEWTRILLLLDNYEAIIFQYEQYRFVQ